MSDTLPVAQSGFCLVDKDSVSAEAVSAVLEHAAVARTHHAVVEITGSGAVQCLQGLITADLEKPGDGAFQYGALLTPKGMIVSDMWAARHGESVVLYLPSQRKDAVLATFTRSLPPRLAQFSDRSADRSLIRIAGARALDVVAQAGLPVPEPGRSDAQDDSRACRPGRDQPFVLQWDATAIRITKLESTLAEAGALAVAYPALHLPRILAGWPSLDAEIDMKTLPQEVRFDEIDGVSHSKGCYLGQETVSRVHFRGHTNKRILALIFDDEPDLDSLVIEQADRHVGRVTSIAWFGPDTGYLGLGMIRREVEPGQSVRACGTHAVTGSLPHHTRA
jgi:folate-binding protein YgfZ